MSDFGSEMGANASEEGPPERQPADGDPAEPASNETHASGSTGANDAADTDKAASAPPAAVSAEEPKTEDSDGAEDGAATGWQRVRQPVLRLPGVAKIANRRQEERLLKKIEEQA